MLDFIAQIKKGKTKRISSYDITGRNADSWRIQPKTTVVLADIKGPGKITHLWLTQGNHYREVLLRFTWDDAKSPSVLVPLGDFFCLGNSFVNSFQSLFFTASTNGNNVMNSGCALNCYLPMPFKKRAVIELINESNEIHNQYFHVDYEEYEDEKPLEGLGYFHAEFHRENPFGGWAHEISVNTPEADIVNKEKLAWDNNYVILETKGKGQYIGCTYSVTNFQGTWWGEGDDMIWIDGYKWPPEIHGTGSEDYLNQAWGMQPNAFLRNGSSVYERNTDGYQSSYIFHVENPVRFDKEVKVTIEFGHGNHLRNEVSSVAYWYSEKPIAVKQVPSVEKRMPVKRTKDGWVADPNNQITSREVPLNVEMMKMKKRAKSKKFPEFVNVQGILDTDLEGNLVIKHQLSRDNLTLYEDSLTEFLEPFMTHKVHVHIVADPNIWENHITKFGALNANGGKIELKEKSSLLNLKDTLKDLLKKKIELEVLKIQEEDRDKSHPAEYDITFMVTN